MSEGKQYDVTERDDRKFVTHEEDIEVTKKKDASGEPPKAAGPRPALPNPKNPVKPI